MKDYGMVEMKDLSEDYPSARDYIERLLRGNNVSDTMVTETLLVFEALCYKIFEQRENPNSPVTVSGFRRMGDSAIVIVFEGGMYDPEPKDPAALTPEDSILRAYADKIDYSYRSGCNRITITTKRSHMVTVGLYAASIILAIAVYALLHFAASEQMQTLVAENLVYPMENLFLNAVLMVGTPVTFLSMLKHLTDTYIIAESHSSAKRLHRNTIISSFISVVLALICSQLFTLLLFSDNPMSGKYFHGDIDLDPEILIPALMPSDLVTPFQSITPYALILLAILTTYAFCSIGKHFDRLKGVIDTAYTLFARMLAIVMYALPFFAIFSILDELFSDGFIMLLYLAEMIAAVLAGLVVLFGYYSFRLLVRGIRPLPYFRKMLPLLRENARIASAFDAVPYNIRYCARTYGFDRKRMEQSMPVLAQINLDGNCFIITMTATLYIAINSTPFSAADSIAVGVLVLLLSLGAPNQPGSCLIGLTIVMLFVQAGDLRTIAIIVELFFGGLLNLTNIAGDLVAAAVEEVRVCGNAKELNERLNG